MKDADVPQLITALDENNTEIVNDSLLSLVMLVQTNQESLIQEHLDEIFPKLDTLLNHDTMSIVVQAS